MNEPRDILAFVSYGNLAVLLMGVGLLGALVHRNPIRRGLSAGVVSLGVLLLCESGTLFHSRAFTLPGSVVIVLVVVAASLFMIRSLSVRNT